MIPLDNLAAFTLSAILLGLAPGPDNLFVVTQAMLYGPKAGLAVVLGLCTGLICYVAAVAFGVAALVAGSLIAFTGLKILGALYLLYLAYQAFTAPAQSPGNTAPRRSFFALYRRGVIMNLSNPKIAVFFLALLPQFTTPENGSAFWQICLLGLIFIAVTIVVFSGFALLSGGIGNRVMKSERFQIVLQRLAGCVFILLAAKLALTRQN